MELETDDSFLQKFFNNKTRIFWYGIMAALLEDETAQKLGICIILNCTEIGQWNNRAVKALVDSFWFSGAAIQSIPCRFTSSRLCYDDPRLGFMINAMKYAMGNFTSVRLRSHLGKFSYLRSLQSSSM